MTLGHDCCRTEDGNALYSLRCGVTGESQEVAVCARHAEQMPLIDGDKVTAQPAEMGVHCEFCAHDRGRVA